jgi:hypothetical protein
MYRFVHWAFPIFALRALRFALISSNPGSPFEYTAALQTHEEIHQEEHFAEQVGCYKGLCFHFAFNIKGLEKTRTAFWQAAYPQTPSGN